jgi:replicative DNA helicase
MPIDILTVTTELDRNDRLAEIGGTSYLTKLVTDTPTSLHASAYAKIVRETSTRRQLLQAANEIAKAAYDAEVSIEETVSKSISSVVDVAGRATAGQTHTSHDVFSSVYDRVDQLSQQPEDQFPGVPTGIFDLDRLLGGGLQPGRLVIIGGRPGQGKTSLILTMLHNIAVAGKKRAAIFSLEMDNDELGQRMVAINSGIDGQIIQTGKLRDDQWNQFTTSIEFLSETNLLFDDTAYLTPSQIRAKCKRIQAQGALDLVVVDYLGLLNSDRQYRNRVDEVSEISRSLKQLARELKVPILAAHQLNREVEGRADKRPQLSDLRDSGSVEQDADVVGLIWQDQREASHVYLDVAKHRNGPTGQVPLLFQRNTTRFQSIARGYPNAQIH